MLHALTVTLFAVVQVLAAWGLGLGLLRAAKCRAEATGPLHERILTQGIAVGAGLGLMSLALTLAFALHAPFRASYVVIAGAGIGLWARECAAAGGGGFRAVGARLRRDAAWVVPQLIVGFILWTECLVPDASPDTYFYHFSVPTYYLLEGGFAPQNLSLMYHYPLVMEALYAPALAFGIEQAAIQLNLFLAFTAWALLIALGTKLGGAKAGWIAGLIYLISPSVMTITPTAHVETGATLFLLAQLALLLRAWETRDPRTLVMAGLLAGLLGGWLVGCKLLYAIIQAPIFLLLCAGTAMGRMRPSNAKAWSLPPVFALGAAAAYLPWALKNAWFLGNPFFPLFMDRFDTPPLIRRYAATQFEIHGLPAWEGPVSFIKGVALSVTDLASSGDVGFQLGLIAWAVLLFWPRMRSRLGFFAWLLAAIFAAMALYGSSFLVRWFLPGYAAFTVAAGVVGSELWSRHRRLLSIPAVALALVLSWNWSADYRARLNDRFTAHHPWTVFSASGLEDLRQRMPARAEIERVNAKVPPEGRVLLMPETTFYGGRGLERRFLAGGGPWIEGMEAEELGPEDMRLRLSAAGITHVLYPLRPEGAQASDFERLLGEPLGRTDKHAVSAVRDGSQARNGLDSERPVSRMP